MLFAQGVIRHTLSNPDDWRSLDAKWMGLLASPGGKMRRIDILGVPFPELGAALIYFTGNDIFNRSLRLKARHMGYSLNQRGTVGTKATRSMLILSWVLQVCSRMFGGIRRLERRRRLALVLLVRRLLGCSTIELTTIPQHVLRKRSLLHSIRNGGT